MLAVNLINLGIVPDPNVSAQFNTATTLIAVIILVTVIMTLIFIA